MFGKKVCHFSPEPLLKMEYYTIYSQGESRRKKLTIGHGSGKAGTRQMVNDYRDLNEGTKNTRERGCMGLPLYLK